MSPEPLSPLDQVSPGPAAGLPLAEELSVVFARMSGLLLSQETVGTSLQLVTALAFETIDASSGSGVTMIDDAGRRSTATTSRTPVQDADALQYELDEGPCLTAWAYRAMVRVDDTASEPRWPRWCEAVQELGVVSVLSTPLVAGGRVLGAMKVYSPNPSAFDDDAERRMSMLAPQAAVLLANVQSHQAATELSTGLQHALQSRDTIATARGILMARDGLDVDDAFAVLVATSQREHTRLRDVAQAVIDSTVRRPR